MLRDLTPHYNLGFGIAPSAAPIATNYRGADPYQTTFDPNSGHIATALYGHPVARFLTGVAATALAIGVASRLKTGEAAIKLSKYFDEAERGVTTWRTSVLHGFRETQRTLDEWEGVGRLFHDQGDKTGLTQGTFKRAGFFISQADREKSLAAAARGDIVAPIHEWSWRDEIQQRLVHRARALPYEMPAIYTAGKVANRLSGQPDQENKVKWYNPIDVIGDFADFSVRNAITQLAPWEVGTGAITQGWRRLLTYGDYVSDTSTFNPHIHLVSVGLKGSLSALGQSTSKLIYETTKRSSQVAGSFGTAINESLNDHQPSGLLYSAKVKRSWQELKQNGRLAAVQQLFPSLSKFPQTLENKWREVEDYNRNFEAITHGRETYEMPPTAKARFDSFRNKTVPPRESRQVNPENIHFGHIYASDIEQFAHAINRNEPFLNQWRSLDAESAFAQMRLKDEYSKNLTNALLAKGPQGDLEYAKAVRKFTNRAKITMGFPRDADARDIMMRRVSFGVGPIHDTADLGGPSWEDTLSKRMAALKIPQPHINNITSNLQQAVHEADIPFQTRAIRDQLNQKILGDWQNIYHGTIIPGIKARTHEVRMPQELVHDEMSVGRRNTSIRKLAASYGIDAEGATNDQLFQRLTNLGIDVHNVPTLKGQLHEQHLISRPWQSGGFNILGLRPMTVAEGLRRNFFAPKLRDKISQLQSDIAGPETIGSAGIQAGRGIYVTQSGQILDLRRFFGSFQTLSDLAARHLQVPVLGFSPYDLTAYHARQRMRAQPILQIESGLGRHFLSGNESKNLDALIYVGGRRRSIGKLYGYRAETGERVDFKGRYRPGLTGGESLLARQTRLAFGETGFHKEPYDNKTKMGRIKNWLNINPVQQDSFVDIASRVKRSSLMNKFRSLLHPDRTFEDDFKNPALYARRIQSIIENGEALKLQDIEGSTEFEKDLRYHYALTPSVIQQLQGFAGDYLQNLFNVLDPVLGNVPLSKIREPSQMYRAAEELLSRDEGNLETAIRGGDTPETARSQLRSARHFLRRAYIDEQTVPGALNASSPRVIKSTGMHRRIDEFRNALYQYIITREIITHEGDTQIIVDLLSTFDKMRSQNLIASHDYVEARAAILGAQVRTASIMGYQTNISPANRLRNILSTFGTGNVINPEIKSILGDLGSYHGKMFGRHDFLGLRRRALSTIGAAAEERNYIKYGVYGGNQQNVYIPTVSTAFAKHPLRTLKSISGYSTWSDPDSFSLASVPVGHLVERLNRYFSLGGLGIDPKAYRGPLSMYTFGMVGKRVLPAVVAANVLNTADRTAGGLVYGKDQYGHRRYKPLVGGTLAAAYAHLDIALTPGQQRREQKKQEYFGDQDIPIRRARYWVLGSGKWKGGRVMYYRPNWYRRYTSGYQYGGQNWKSPTEQLLYGNDFSPLKYLDEYKWEKEHYYDRPYPQSGQAFSGPWGPLTSVLNMTVGKVLKPTINMHQDEVAHGLSMYQAAGYNGMVYNPSLYHEGQQPLIIGRAPTGAPAVYGTATAGQILGMQESALVRSPIGDYKSPYRQPWGFMGMPYGTTPNAAIESYRSNKGYQITSGVGPIAQAAGGNAISNQMLANVNNYYVARANTPTQRASNLSVPLDYSSTQQAPLRYGSNPYNQIVLTPNRTFDPRVVVKSNPLSYHDLSVQGGQFGYEAQEMAGIYGFTASNFRAALGLGAPNLSPKRPVLQSADRAYGSERSFWDLNLGGLGDFPIYGTSDFGNIELSEIIRRFIPHRRRDINEINPIPNTEGQKFPWLSGSDYFINYKMGDPYCLSASTLVESGNLQFVRADTICYSNELISHNGQKTNVIDLDIIPPSKTITIQTTSLPAFPITCSLEHPFLTRTLIKGRKSKARIQLYKQANKLLAEVSSGGTRCDMADRAGIRYSIAAAAWKLLEKYHKVKINRKGRFGIVEIIDAMPFDEYLLSHGLEFVPAENLHIGDYVAYPKIPLDESITYIDLAELYPWKAVTDKYVYSIAQQSTAEAYEYRKGESTKKVPIDSNVYCYVRNDTQLLRYERFVSLDYDLGRFVGLWCAEGSADNTCIYMSHHVVEREDVIAVYKNIGLCANWYRCSDSNGAISNVSNRAMVQLVTYLCGSGARTKVLNDDFIHYPIQFLEGFIEGLFYGDGCRFNDCGRDIASLKTSSWQLALQVRKLLLSLGIVSSTIYNKEDEAKNYSSVKNTIYSGDSYTVKISNAGNQTSYGCQWFDDEDFYYFRIQKIKEDIEQITYGFTTESHTFCAVGVATHNTKRDQAPGEMLLPGGGYELLHPLHPDFTGKYGLLDQQRILANTAAWSNEYKAVNQVLQRSNLSPEDRAYFQQTKKMVASIKKKQQFYPYSHAHNQFRTTEATITGFIPGEADMLITNKGIVKFAGVRARSNQDAMDWLQNSLKPQQKVQLTYDANYPPKRDQPLEAIVEANGRNINEELLSNPDLAYPSKKQSPLDTKLKEGNLLFNVHDLIERTEHANTWFNNKFIAHRTAIEDWERNYVYGSSFPTWNNPFSSFIKPLSYRAMNRNPIEAAIALGTAGRLFTRTPEAKAVGTAVGAVTGAGLALFSNTKTYQTGERFLPQQYKKAANLDEYIAMLNYVKYTRLYAAERRAAMRDEGVDPEKIAQEISRSSFKSHQFTNIGPETSAALQYRNQIQQNLFGANIWGDVMNLAAAVPKQQRTHFLEFLNAPINERGRILSTMSRLERRIFEARWGMQVEQRPDIVNYFAEHELPPPQWSGWSPSLGLENVKIKMAQHEGLNLSQMGYYPQQISEANALNIPYPQINNDQSPHQSAAALRALMSANNLAGVVQVLPSNQPGSMIELHMGVTS